MANSNPTTSTSQFDRLKILFEYTKFHIGLYTVLLTALLGLMSLGSEQLPREYHLPARITALFFILAGAAGGVVASSICKYSGIDAFRDAWIGPWGGKCLKAKGKVWASLEHLFFWLGILNAALSIWWGKDYFLASAPAAHLGLSIPWGL